MNRCFYLNLKRLSSIVHIVDHRILFPFDDFRVSGSKESALVIGDFAFRVFVVFVDVHGYCQRYLLVAAILIVFCVRGNAFQSRAVDVVTKLNIKFN